MSIPVDAPTSAYSVPAVSTYCHTPARVTPDGYVICESCAKFCCAEENVTDVISNENRKIFFLRFIFRIYTKMMKFRHKIIHFISQRLPFNSLKGPARGKSPL